MNKRMVKLGFVIMGAVSLLITVNPAVGRDIYKCVEDGSTIFSDTPCSKDLEDYAARKKTKEEQKWKQYEQELEQRWEVIRREEMRQERREAAVKKVDELRSGSGMRRDLEIYEETEIMCKWFRKANATECGERSGFGNNNQLDVRANMTAQTAVEICNILPASMSEVGVKKMLVQHWTINFFTPFSGDHPIWVCYL